MRGQRTGGVMRGGCLACKIAIWALVVALLALIAAIGPVAAAASAAVAAIAAAFGVGAAFVAAMLGGLIGLGVARAVDRLCCRVARVCCA